MKMRNIVLETNWNKIIWSWSTKIYNLKQNRKYLKKTTKAKKN